MNSIIEQYLLWISISTFRRVSNFLLLNNVDLISTEQPSKSDYIQFDLGFLFKYE
jgi:hypothetical protein